MSRSSKRTHRISRGLSAWAVLASLSINPGCAKLHHKLHKHKHKHDEVAIATFPARSSHQGFASVSPQMPQVITSPATKQEPISYSAVSPPLIEPAKSAPVISPQNQMTSPFSQSVPAETTPPQTQSARQTVPQPVTITPKTPPPAGPTDAPAQNPPAAKAPETAKDKIPADLPASLPPPVNDALPAPAPPVTDEKNTPPGLPQEPAIPTLDKNLRDLPAIPPPVPQNQAGIGIDRGQAIELPPSTTSISPFSNQVPTNSTASGNSVLTLSLPGIETDPNTEVTSKPNSAAETRQTEETAVASGITELGKILNKTRDTLSRTNSYKVEVSLQEQMNGRILPQDKFVLYKRREPLALRMEWKEGKDVGREVIYSPVETKGMIQIRMPKGLIPRMTMSPESPLVRSKSRHPISEAGADSVVERLMATLEKFRSNHPEAGDLTVEMANDPTLGAVNRVTHRTHEGEVWVVDMDVTTGLPLTIHATDNSGQLLEHYEFRGYELNLPELLTAEAFDQNSRWGSNKLLGRLASGTSKDDAKR